MKALILFLLIGNVILVEANAMLEVDIVKPEPTKFKISVTADEIYEESLTRTAYIVKPHLAFPMPNPYNKEKLHFTSGGKKLGHSYLCQSLGYGDYIGHTRYEISRVQNSYDRVRTFIGEYRTLGNGKKLELVDFKLIFRSDPYPMYYIGILKCKLDK